MIYENLVRILPIGEAISFNFPITTRAKPNLLGTNFKIGSLIYYNSVWLYDVSFFYYLSSHENQVS